MLLFNRFLVNSVLLDRDLYLKLLSYPVSILGKRCSFLMHRKSSYLVKNTYPEAHLFLYIGSKVKVEEDSMVTMYSLYDVT